MVKTAAKSQTARVLTSVVTRCLATRAGSLSRSMAVESRPDQPRRNLARASESGGAHRIEEAADLALEPVAVGRQRLRRSEHLRGCRAGLARTALHVGDGGRDLLGALGCLLHA